MAEDPSLPAERFPRRSARRQQTRMRIIEAALSEFKRVGYGEATMNAIAEIADVHVTTLFTHFKTKRELAAALSDAEIASLESLIAKARGKIPFFDFFRQLVLTIARDREEQGDPRMGLARELRQDPELASGWLKYEEREIFLLADYIAQDFGLHVRTDYAPYLMARVLISSGVISYTRWSAAKSELSLVAETTKALDMAERMARSILGQQAASPEVPAKRRGRP